MEFVEIYSHTKNKNVGYETRDDLGRLIYSKDCSEESECDEMSIVYKDTEDGKSYKSVIAKTKYLIVDKRKRINTNAVVNDYICGYEIPKIMITEECDEFGKLIKSSNIKFDINVDVVEELNFTEITCKPSNSNAKGYIRFVIDNSNNFINEYINSYENIYYAFDRYKYLDKSDPTNEHEVIRFEEYDGIFLQKYTIINRYDGLYERDFEFDRNDNFLGGRIKFYFDNKTLSHECILDKYKSIVETIIYHYGNDGKLSYTTSKGEKLTEYIYICRNI